jgi:hypothetical protein
MPNIKIEVFILTILASLGYTSAHLFNAWAFQVTELTSHVNWIYLPAFLRLANVIVLGSVFGSLATGLGVCTLYFFYPVTLTVLIMNCLASMMSPLLAFFIFRICARRDVLISSIRDLLILNFIYAVMNAITHHLAWIIVDPDQLMRVDQVPVMFLGDFFGACLGACLFTLIADKLGLISYAEQRAKD